MITTFIPTPFCPIPPPYGELSLLPEMQVLEGIAFSPSALRILACSSEMEPRDYLQFVFKCAALVLRSEVQLNVQKCWDGVFFLAARYAAKLSTDQRYQLEFTKEWDVVSKTGRLIEMKKYIWHIEGWCRDDYVEVPEPFRTYILNRYDSLSLEEWADRLILSDPEQLFIRNILLRMPKKNRYTFSPYQKDYDKYKRAYQEDVEIVCKEDYSRELRNRIVSFAQLYRSSLYGNKALYAWMKNNVVGFSEADYITAIRGFLAFRDRSQSASIQ